MQNFQSENLPVQRKLLLEGLYSLSQTVRASELKFWERHDLNRTETKRHTF